MSQPAQPHYGRPGQVPYSYGGGGGGGGPQGFPPQQDLQKFYTPTPQGPYTFIFFLPSPLPHTRIQHLINPLLGINAYTLI
jgi:hypothetical protein